MKLTTINLKLTPEQARLLFTAVKAAANNDKTHYYLPEAARELEVVARQIKSGITNKPAIGEL